MAGIIALVIIGGIKRIGKVTGFLAPFMAIIYVSAAGLVLIANADLVGESFRLIFKMAFNPPAELAGVGGGTFLIVMNTMMWGVKRGLFSNEAGQGSAAIAHATAKTKYPVREGTVSMLGPFIDTLLICTLTGLVILTTGAWHHTAFYTSFAFKEGLSWLFAYGDKIITLAIVLFAISTIISWSFYGDRATEFLFGERSILPYKWIFVTFVFIGGVAELEAIWAFGDAALGFMTIPNLLSIILLSGTLKRTTKKYFSQKHIPYKKK
jgi:AGCS family alanine or glycine:cation symporter